MEPPALRPLSADFAFDAFDFDDRRLIAVVDGAAAEAARRAGERLVCRAGCTECCLGPFPITALDAARLEAGLSGLAASDAGRAGRVRERANAAARALAADFPGDARSGVLGEDEAARDAFFTRHAAMPCPVLDPETGFCELYAHRPVSCRTFGPPMRIEGEALPPCRLCFQGSPAEEIEACRVTLDCHDIEGPLTARVEEAVARSGETVIAMALGKPSPSRISPDSSPIRS
jgi:Fe-S-cluster containining protein